MAQTIEIPGLPSGESGMTCNLAERSTDTSVATALALTELTNGKSHYRCSTSSSATGWHVAVAKYSDATVAGSWWVYLTGTAVVHYAGDIGPPYDGSTATTPSAPADPSLSTGYVQCVDESGAAESGVQIKAYMTAGPGSDGYAYDSAEFTFTSDATGLAQHVFVRSATYKARRSVGQEYSFTVANAGTFQLPEMLGRP